MARKECDESEQHALRNVGQAGRIYDNRVARQAGLSFSTPSEARTMGVFHLGYSGIRR